MTEIEVLASALAKYNNTFRLPNQERISLETVILGQHTALESIEFINLMLIIEEALSENDVYKGDIFSLIEENERIETLLEICKILNKNRHEKS